MTLRPPPGRARPVSVLVSSFLAVAVAGWLAPASVHIVQWPASGPVRLALLLPAWQLAVWVAAGAMAVVIAVLWCSRSEDRLATVSGAAAPLSLLWVWGIPYLPWLPDQLPLLLVLAGPLRWLIAAAAAVWAIARWKALPAWVPSTRRFGRGAAFAVSLAIYVIFGLYAARSMSTGGDEPHYLIITESLLRDGDLKIENNHQQRDYLPFFQGNLRPDFFERGRDGEIYSIHAPGLPALILPVYAIAGRLGAVVFVALLAALTALAVFDLAEAIGGRPMAVAAWASCCLTVPFIPYAWLIFPEMPGALVVAWAALWMWTPVERSPAAWALRGLALSTLPWLHTKFVVFLAIFGLALAFRLRRRPTPLVAFSLPIALSAVLWLYSFYAIYGVFDPEAPYGAYTSVYVLTANIPHGLLGLFFDQKFGLLPYSPIYLCALAGAWRLFQRRDTRLLAATLLLAVAAFVGSTARLYMFWGGSSAPARFLVPLLPCLAPMVGLGIILARSALSRGLVALWFGISLAVAAIGMGWPSRLVLFSADHGKARLLEMIQGGSPLSLVMPTFTDPDWPSHVPLLAAWAVVALAAFGLAAAASRRGWSGAAGSVGVACAAFLVGGAAVTARPGAEVRAPTARRGAIDVLWRFDGSRFRTLDYETMGRTPPERFVALTTVPVTAPADRTAATIVSDPVTLPAGAYDAVVWFDEARPRTGDIIVADPPHAVFGRLEGALPSPSRVAFEMPVAARRLTVTVADAAIASKVTRVEIVPRGVVPPGLREPRPVRALEPIPGWDRAFVGYTDEHAYPEGGIFWTRGTAETMVLVAPGGATRITLTLSTGPVSGPVTLSVAGQLTTVNMVGGRDLAVSFDLPAGVRIVPLSVASAVMFRPAEVDPSSTDRRGLGCQVRISLE